MRALQPQSGLSRFYIHLFFNMSIRELSKKKLDDTNMDSKDATVATDKGCDRVLLSGRICLLNITPIAN